MRRRLPRDLALFLIVVLSLSAYASIAWQRRQAGTLLSGVRLQQGVFWYLFAFVLYLAAMFWLEKHGDLPRRWVWGVALLLRLPLFLAPPALSDDVYRYLWDGHLAKNGVSPYAYAIDDPHLDYLDTPQRQLTNHPWMATPYPPAAQILFAGMAMLFPSLAIFLQIGMAVFDLLGAILLARLLALAQLPDRRLLLYLWHPLIIVEFASSAHLGAWVIMLSLASVILTYAGAGRAAKLLAPTMLALATLSWIVPILLLPVLLWRWSWQQRLSYALVATGLLLPSGIRAGWGLTGTLDGTGLFGALRIYVAQWNFNSGLFHWLERALGAPGYGPPSPVAKWTVLAVVALVLLVVMAVARRRLPVGSDLRLMAVPLMAYLLLSPTVHPWYAPLLLVFLPFLSPSARESPWQWLMLLPWIYLSGALLLSYLTYLDPVNPGELYWVRLVEWLPTLAFLVLAVVSTMVRRAGANQGNRPHPDHDPDQLSQPEGLWMP